MTVPSPKIDSRSYEEIVDQTALLVEKSGLSWVKPEGTADAGLALIRIFGRMAKLVSDRINQTPDKNFLAFLDLIGTRVAPPPPAHVPLTFSLAEGSPEDAFVPAGTQVAAPATETSPEVIFELEEDVVVVRSQLQAACSRHRQSDCYSDHTAAITGTASSPTSLFQPDAPIPHILYLVCDEILTRPGKKTVIVTLTSAQAETLQQLPVEWAYWDIETEAWIPLEPTSSVEASSQRLSFQFPQIPALTPHLVDNQLAAWLRAAVTLSTANDETLPDLSQIVIEAVTVNLAPNEAVTIGTPDRCFFNTTPLDLSKPFFPFGEQPSFNDTFYIASQEAFSQAGTTVSMTVDVTSLSSSAPTASSDLELTWEYWDDTAKKWSSLGTSTNLGAKASENNPPKSPILEADETKALTVTEKQIKLKLLEALATCKVNGEENYWLRVRISRGIYGQPAEASQPQNTYSPPVITSIALSYSLIPGDTAVQLLAYNNFAYSHPNQPPSAAQPFQPFTYSQDADPAFYLGFDQPFPNRAVALYIQVDPLKPGQLTRQITHLSDTASAGHSALAVESTWGFRPGQSIRLAPGSEFQQDAKIRAIHPDSESVARGYHRGALVLERDLTTTFAAQTRLERIAPPPQLVWEYQTALGWQPLGVVDETEGFTDRGLVRFIGPTGWVDHSDFGRGAYWLRVRWAAGDFLVIPQLRRVLTNTAWAAAVVTLTNEVLGSSTGNPKQQFVANQAPILPGEQLEVQEVLPPAEQATLAAAGKHRLTPADTLAGGRIAHWVRWQEVIDFYGSGPRDRHYRLNRLTGEITFGDGFQGLIPSLGRQNVRLTHYRTGGGPQGNQPAHTIEQLKTTVPYVDGVTNHEAASGAAPQESLERVKERGPKQLRHRDRAVTAQDIEDLAFEASAEVARARAITPAFSADLDPLPVYYLPITTRSLTLTLTWTERQVGALVVALYGPGQAQPWRYQDVTKASDTTISLPSLNVEPAAGTPAWRLVLSNTHVVAVTAIAGTLSYTSDPDPDQNAESKVVDVPSLTSSSRLPYAIDLSTEIGPAIDAPITADSTRNSHSLTSLKAGRVEVVIVPRTLGRQPTPSLGLLNRVETYLRQRCSPTLALHVTEPHWVEVTVIVTLAPTSFQVADTVRTQALQALTKFLHPLTGGPQGQGWSFDRRPHESDLYAVLGKVTGVDHIATLTMTPARGDPLPAHFLIFSGSHSVTLRLS